VVPPPDGGYPGGNTAEGQNALLSLTSGGFDTAVGYFSLRSDTTGSYNTAVGAGAFFANTGGELGGGDNNTATGVGALLGNSNGGFNTANGAFALASTGGGCGNAAFGYRALFNTVGTDCGLNGSFNTAVGEGALQTNTLGNNNIALGANAGSNVTTSSNVICIGALGANVNDSCYIGNIFGATSASGVGVFVNSNGRLGTMTSSLRFKDEIKPMDKASEVLYALKPVSFHYNKEIDPAGKSQFGLVAEDVEKVNPALVVRDKEGKPYSVQYDQVNAMLLNEFLKEHRRVEKLEATVAALTSQLQRVSARLEMNHSAAQVVVSNH
jgi:trimeric autotransporter adhesin